jgi:hypothetical protein
VNKKLKLSVLATTLSLLVALIAVPVGAAAPLAVHFDVTATIAPDADLFVASGPAVDAGAMCPAGDSTNTSIVASTPSGGTTSTLRVLKHFVCGDGSGTFDISMIVRLDLTTHYTTARWRIVSGTGDYAHLHGNGSLNGTPIVPGESILDVYDGMLY